MSGDCSVIFINTISGGIVNFGGTNKIAPVSISKTTTGSRPSTSGQMTSESNIPSNLSGAIEGTV
ncbi:spore germination protein [Neobacillus sp. PS3-12]|uniref:spore germination protein n=1 Tax=Neobacillus sp. PS3-12 TaxID=3070677 RepID=UPI0027E1F075|nr:spore germination protein [Neobacillus sp. PS3-12]WML51153.1 spore germination protein [Neobacillus sp. PS3-12]